MNGLTIQVDECLCRRQSNVYAEDIQRHVKLIMLTIIKPLQKPFHSRTQSRCFESGFFYFECGVSKVKSGFYQRRVRIFFSSPGASPVRVSKYTQTLSYHQPYKLQDSFISYCHYIDCRKSKQRTASVGLKLSVLLPGFQFHCMFAMMVYKADSMKDSWTMLSDLLLSGN